MDHKTTAYLALGSNMDDRMAFLLKAKALLEKCPAIKIIKASVIYETDPWPKPLSSVKNSHPHEERGQKWFLNQVIEIATVLTPEKLLSEIKTIEKSMGRQKREHWGAREIDIDILLYGHEILDTPDLQIPHRHIEDRQFVLVPLVEIAPHLKDPITGRKFTDILEEIRIKDDHQVTPFF